MKKLKTAFVFLSVLTIAYLIVGFVLFDFSWGLEIGTYDYYTRSVIVGVIAICILLNDMIMPVFFKKRE